MNEQQLLVFTPNSAELTPEKLRKPFVLVGEVPQESSIISLRALPSVLELLGMVPGGGPPGISVLGPVGADTAFRYFFGVLPGSTIMLRSSACSVGPCIGACTSAGILVHYFEAVFSALYPAEARGKLFEDLGYALINLVPYVTPPELMNLSREGTG